MNRAWHTCRGKHEARKPSNKTSASRFFLLFCVHSVAVQFIGLVGEGTLLMDCHLDFVGRLGVSSTSRDQTKCSPTCLNGATCCKRTLCSACDTLLCYLVGTHNRPCKRHELLLFLGPDYRQNQSAGRSVSPQTSAVTALCFLHNDNRNFTPERKGNYFKNKLCKWTTEIQM